MVSRQIMLALRRCMSASVEPGAMIFFTVGALPFGFMYCARDSGMLASAFPAPSLFSGTLALEMTGYPATVTEQGISLFGERSIG